MLLDIRRIGTFLAYKGFQWEPISPLGQAQGRPVGFIASREGETSFCGMIVSVGTEASYDGRPVRVVDDDGERENRLARLKDRLEKAAEPVGERAAEMGLPFVSVVVNHDPRCRFEDLTRLLEDRSAKATPAVDLFFWFDDFGRDRMLYRRSDPAVHEMLFDWFHAAGSL